MKTSKFYDDLADSSYVDNGQFVMEMKKIKEQVDHDLGVSAHRDDGLKLGSQLSEVGSGIAQKGA